MSRVRGFCEDYPCCGHTSADPCDGVTGVADREYCPECGFEHAAGGCW